MRALTLLVCLLAWSATAAADAKRIAVNQFAASSDSHARQGVLAVLSDHDDVEVVSLEDIAFAANRVKADLKTIAGRAKVAEEVGVDAWLDGEIDGSDAHLVLARADGKVLVKTDVHATTARLLEGLIGDRMWAAMGPRLSDRERVRRDLLAAADLARKKIEDREQEVLRQRGLAEERARHRTSMLRAARELALKRQASIVAEVARQEQLAHDRQLEQTREQQQAEESRRKAEMARLAQVAAAQQPAWAPAAEPPSRTPPSSGSQWAAPAQSAEYGAGYASTNTGVSNATQRWLQSQRAGQPSYTAPPTQPPAVATNGVSLATQRWLEQQQGH